MDNQQIMLGKYEDLLTKYLRDSNEQLLYKGQKLSRQSIENDITPEEIVAIHKSVLQNLYPDIPKKVVDSFDLLLEVMIGYGLVYLEHQLLRDQQEEIKSEMEIAANVQQTLLGTKVPTVKGLDIGAISIPARQMNGDYFHFVEDESGSISVAVADVIGKGIPAALCMSMIKYAMDSLPESRNRPSFVLENLNRVVEQNVDITMFITMVYGMFDAETNYFTYSSAGHEPGFHYSSKEEKFYDLNPSGLVLGVDKSMKYKEHSLRIEEGDMIILLSDGVTETRSDEGFIEREDIVQLVRKFNHLPAQEIVESIYKELVKLQDFQLKDDFTLIIFKRIGL
ncbi:sigma-B regulation protein RsbU (phosphoserine phosphatase) [Bacillus mesophilus]|uniref:PP2C family protein-serine/threonine phosphatase n=1 Tax=Bacillus mesophilus TaxID=1808955 RepID=A0A6M0QBZ9_9BACI|nr:PP2C family protein-serine/threonine phosphatase [Bacillus mesophilus]MBM7663130.1 sigma-B regulation protein RsbU (phosphoserine phosphatase) [Bacillus mesophilus]NEY73894.1 PP2C family protein-serine/threonine phosphatase [Bacillus mesophilus]